MSGYPNFLKYFMWQWQVHFKISCQVNAESLFNKLDTKLQPNVFLVGFLNKNLADKLPICVDPENLDFLIDNFHNIQEVADELYMTDSDRNMFYSGEGMQEEMDNRLKRKSFRLALEKILNELPQNSDKIYFASSSALIDNYRVFVILELNKNVYYSHKHLSRIDPEERVTIHHSLLETVKNSYLKDSFRNMNLPEPNGLSSDARSSDELLREGVKEFMHSIAWVGKNIEGVHILNETCNKMSIYKYEGLENNGHLIIVEKNHPDIEMVLEIETPFNISDFRKTRKILQLSNEHIGVICNSKEVMGLGKIKPTYDISEETIINIYFRGIHCWEVMHHDKTLLKMRYGLPQLPSEIIAKEPFFSDAKRLFSGVNDEQLENLYSLAVAITKQKKGAMLVIVKDAENEAIRLQKQCINIKPIKVKSDLILSLTSIDGAVLIDLNGIAYAKGVILDGIVGNNGDAARGSRFNSAITYEEHRGLDCPTMIVVVSEDETVNIIPNFVPQINHREIKETIAVLENLNVLSNFSRQAFYNAMSWLQSRQFYLNEDECKRVNKLKNDLEELDSKAGGTAMWIKHPDLFPNPMMNSSYLN
jgi:DNA integrity scanning protein DisA with diadenylate cyclase activity